MRPIKKFIVKCDTWQKARDVGIMIETLNGKYYEMYATNDGMLYKRLTMNGELPPAVIIYDGELTDIMPMLIRLFKDEYEIYEYKNGTQKPWQFLEWCFGKTASYNGEDGEDGENGYVDTRIKREGKPIVNYRLEILEILIEMKKLSDGYERERPNKYWHRMQELVDKLGELVAY